MASNSDDIKKTPYPDFTRGLHGAGALKPEGAKQPQQPQQPQSGKETEKK